jgi:hypothetical protein
MTAARPVRRTGALARDARIVVATTTIACVLGACSTRAGAGHAGQAAEPSSHGPSVSSNSRPAPPSSQPAPSHGQPAWLLTRPALSKVTADPGVRTGLGRARVYQLLQPGQRPLGGFATVPVVTFTAVADLVRAVTQRQLPPGTGAVLYDPEAWSLTPAAEQRNPGQAAQQAAAAAHAHGLQLIVAPALNLVTVRGRSPAPRWQQFLSLRIAAAVAAHADIVELQAQSLERDTAGYASFVRQAAAQVTTANPRATVLAGLSTNPPGAAVSSQQLTAAIQATRGTVGGYWLNIPGQGPKCPTCNASNPQTGIQVLRAALPTG